MKRGFALPLTLLVLVVIGGLVAAILFTALIGRRSGAAMLEMARLQFAAEAAAHRAAAELSTVGATSLPVIPLPNEVRGVSVTRFGPPVWSVVAEEVGRAGAVRRAGLLLVSRQRNFLLRRGLTTPGPVFIGGPGRVDLYGLDAGEGCEAEADDSAAPGDFSSTNRESLEGWLGRVTKLVPPGGVVSPEPAIVGALCDEGVITNWGDATDPIGACGSYYPAVGVVGDLVVEGGQGQGVLAVAGNLTARLDFRFRGLVLVGGRLVLENGARMIGAVQVDDSLREGTVLNGGHIGYSGCVIREALSDFGMISVLRDRGWFQPF